MRVTSFKHSLLSVDMDVCIYVCGYVCGFASLWWNISETKGDSGLFPIGSL